MDFSELGLEGELLKAVRKDAGIQRGLDQLAKEVKDFWQEIAPVDSGQYAASVKIKKARDENGDPIRRVGTNHPAAHIIEYGSSDTPKFAVRAKVEGHFGD